jgi:transcription elongation GreA/GreB family factor
MSVAFTREDSAQTAQEVSLPDRPISPHPNIVTESGWAALEAALAESRIALEAAQRIEADDERRRAVDMAARDVRYYNERLRTAQIRPPPLEFGAVAFGNRVTIQRDDGRKQMYRIVGEDEADPRKETISYVSPLARALTGKGVGDVVQMGGHDIEILAIA